MFVLPSFQDGGAQRRHARRSRREREAETREATSQEADERRKISRRARNAQDLRRMSPSGEETGLRCLRFTSCFGSKHDDLVSDCEVAFYR